MSQTTDQPADQPAEEPGRPEPTPAGSAAQPDRVSSPALPRIILILAALAAALVVSIRSGSFPVVGFVLAIIASVTLHEAGHYLTAKWSGMKVTEFFFGFGPRLWSFRKGETEYGVKAIPAGGYVKIIGMSNVEKDIDPADEGRTYRQQSYPKRMLVALAGIATHLIIAFLLLLLMWTAVGVPRDDRPTLVIGTISKLNSGPSPAQEAGFKVGDRIVSVDGQAVARWDDLPPYIRARAGQAITFVVERDGRVLTLTATPASVNPEGEKVGFVGIGSKTEVQRVGVISGIGHAAGDVGGLSVASVKALGAFFSPKSISNLGDQLQGKPSTAASDASRPVSVVGATRIAGQAAKHGLFDFLAILVMLNIFVAVLNAVPLPPFDGGHVAIATYERIRSRKGKRYFADAQKLMPVTAAVVLFMVLLGLTTMWLDIVHPVANPFQ